jgi:hypothetical protein
MQPVQITYTTTGAKDPIALDWRVTPFNVAYNVVKNTGGGTLSATVQVTMDDIMDPNVTPAWIDVGVALTASALAALTTLAQAIRLNIATLSGTTVTFKLLQGESID